MNERIKELAEKAGCKVMDDGDWYIPSATGLEKIVYTSGIGLEKFAELIVRECADVLVAEMNRLDGLDRVVASQTMDTAQVLIKQHFGVEK